MTLYLVLPTDQSILHRFRGHDTEITSLDWIRFHNHSSTPATPAKPVRSATPVTPATPSDRTKIAARSRRKAQPIVDHGDMFDIHSYDYLENEFGTLSSNTMSDVSKHQLSFHSNEDFDFVEACQSLKEDILRPPKPEGEEYEVNKSEIPEFDGSDESDQSGYRSDEDVDVNDSLRPVELEGRTDAEADTLLSVVSASQEPFVWIWNVKTGAAFDKISLRSPHKTSDVKLQGKWEVIDLCRRVDKIWKNSQAWRLNGWTKKRSSPILRTEIWFDTLCRWWTISEATISSFHHKLFVIISNFRLTCTASKDTYKEKSIFNLAVDRNDHRLWAVSLKRSILCADAHDSEKTFMWNSTLAEKLYTICESPHDMNKWEFHFLPTAVQSLDDFRFRIAVAGKTRSVYTLDASNFSPFHMKTAVYANRIKAKVISVAWHPSSENLLAFSTAEGRVSIDHRTVHQSCCLRIKILSPHLGRRPWHK